MTEQPSTPAGQHESGLSEVEKQMLRQLIERGEQLPDRYRSVLFAPPEEPELVWPGKYSDEQPSGTTFDVVERVQGPEPLDGLSNPASGAQALHPWRNRLFWGDNTDAMAALSTGRLHREIEAAGGIRLIYIDPPFNVGADFECSLALGDGAGSEARRIKARAYRDSWGAAGAPYLSMMYGRLRQMHDLLAEEGSLYLHCDWRSSSMLRLLLDEIFGCEGFVNEIVWYYYNKYSAAKRCLPRAHDTIWVYSKTGKHTLNPLREPREEPQRQLVRKNVGGVLKNARDAQGRLIYRTVTDKKCDDVWRIPQLQPASAEWSGYGTQKHHALLERIILTASNPGDLIADFFSGSGTTLAVAQRLGRRWIGCDAGQLAIHTTRKRLLTPSASAGQDSAAVDFDLLFPRPTVERQQTMVGIEGQSGARTHSGAGTSVTPPAPDPGLPAYRAEFAVELRGKGLEVSLSLTGFSVECLQPPEADAQLAVKNGKLMRRDLQKGGGLKETVLTRSWTDWVDAWAVDFDYGGAGDGPGGRATFRAHWRSFRTYKSRDLRLESAKQTYGHSCQGNIAVQVIDIFGNCWLRVLNTE